MSDVIVTNYGSGFAFGKRKAVVGHSGGATSAWSLGWALNFLECLPETTRLNSSTLEPSVAAAVANHAYVLGTRPKVEL